MTIPAREALERLREGNLRFAANVRGSDAFVSHTRRVELAAGQQPFAIILGCSDSRVPAEIVFDQGLRGAVYYATRGRPWPLSVRGHPGHSRGAAYANRKSVAEPAGDRRPGAAFG